MASLFPDLTPAAFRAHALHDPSGPWPETNCHSDLWIELLSRLGREPRAAFGMALAQDFEGDQFTFFKIALGDLLAFYGVDVQELSIYRPLHAHLTEQIDRGRVPLVEVDAFFLPDTRGVSYRQSHAKTTIAVAGVGLERPRLAYFHNAGFFEADGDDAAALLDLAGTATLPPYVEFAKVDRPGLSGGALRHAAAARLGDFLALRPAVNPLLAYGAALGDHLGRLFAGPQADFHAYAFNTTRQIGAAHSLLSAHLVWLGPAFGEAARAAGAIAAGAKTLQFLLARACARKRAEGLAEALASLARAWVDLGLAVEAGLDETRRAPPSAAA